MSLFGNKKGDSRTILLLDVESSSVASALALLSPSEQPKVFGEVRINLPLAQSLDTASLIPQIEKAAREALVHAAEVAARLRVNDSVSNLGNIHGASVFLSAPWGSPNLSQGRQRFISPLQRSLAQEVEGYTGLMPQFYTGADSAVFGTKRLLPQEPLLLCVIRGETAELILLSESGVEGYATLPTGLSTVFRTLGVHGGLSQQEVRSAFELSLHPSASPHEALDAAAQHFVEQFAGAAEHLLANGVARGVYIIAAEPMGQWFAKALSSDDSLGEYFPEGATVRAMRPHHLSPHVSAHSSQDLSLMLEALFSEAKYRV